MSFTYFYILCRWNDTGYVLWCLASLAPRSIYETQPYYCLCFLDAHSLCCLVFPCMSQFVHQLFGGHWFFVWGLVPPEYHDHSCPSLLVNGCTYSGWVCIGLGVEMLCRRWWMCSDWKDTGGGFSKTFLLPHASHSQLGRRRGSQLFGLRQLNSVTADLNLHSVKLGWWVAGILEIDTERQQTRLMTEYQLPKSRCWVYPDLRTFLEASLLTATANAHLPSWLSGGLQQNPAVRFLRLPGFFCFQLMYPQCIELSKATC